MKRLTYILAILLVGITISCNDHKETESSPLLTNLTQNVLDSENRAAPDENVLINATTFTIIGEAIMAEEIYDSRSDLRAVLDSYQLEVDGSFDLEDYKGFTVTPKAILDSPIDIGKEISLIESVVMVEVHEPEMENVAF